MEKYINLLRRIDMKLRRKIFHYLKFQPRQNFFLDSPIGLPRTDVKRLELYAQANKLVTPHINYKEDDVVYSFQRRYIYEIDNAIIDPFTGMIYDQNGKFIAESMAWEPTRLLSEIPRPVIKKVYKFLKGKYLFLPSTPTYFHWLLQDLPPFIIAYERFSNLPVITGMQQFAPHEYFIKTFLKENDIYKFYLPVRVEKLIFAAKDAGQGTPFPPHSCVNPIDVKILRNFFRDYIFTNKKELKIYLSRRKWKRTFKGEDKIEQKLKELGFIVFDGNLDLISQIQLFSKASIIVGRSGAAMSNMIWMQKGSKVIQLCVNQERFNFYYNLSYICSHKFKFLDIDINDIDTTINKILETIEK